MSAVALLGLLLHGQLLLGLGLLLSWSATRLGVGPRAAHRLDRALLVLALALPPALAATPYARWGDGPVLALVIALFTALGLSAPRMRA